MEVGRYSRVVPVSAMPSIEVDTKDPEPTEYPVLTNSQKPWRVDTEV